MEYVIAAVLVVGTLFLHFAALRYLAHRIKEEARIFQRPLLVVVLTLFIMHLVEVQLFATGFYALEWLGAGTLDTLDARGDIPASDFFYFSIACYTTLGIGDIVPHGGARFLAGVEALNGLVLITWSASFTYLMMERLWAGEIGPIAD